MTKQSPEADGAMPMNLPADWFNGKADLELAHYLPEHKATAKDVDKFLPDRR